MVYLLVLLTNCFGGSVKSIFWVVLMLMSMVVYWFIHNRFMNISIFPTDRSWKKLGDIWKRANVD